MTGDGGMPGDRAVSAPPTLLVLRVLGLGDLLTAVPALRALARAFPRHRRVVAMPRALAPLAMLSGAIHEVLDARPLAPLRCTAPDIAVNLHGRGPESHRVLLALRPRRSTPCPRRLASAVDGDGGSPARRRRKRGPRPRNRRRKEAAKSRIERYAQQALKPPLAPVTPLAARAQKKGGMRRRFERFIALSAECG